MRSITHTWYFLLPWHTRLMEKDEDEYRDEDEDEDGSVKKQKESSCWLLSSVAEICSRNGNIQRVLKLQLSETNRRRNDIMIRRTTVTSWLVVSSHNGGQQMPSRKYCRNLTSYYVVEWCPRSLIISAKV